MNAVPYPSSAPAKTLGALTRRQFEVLDFVAAFLAEHGFPPTHREIGEHFGIRSTNCVSGHLRALERKGFLSISLTKSRGLALAEGIDLTTLAAHSTQPVDAIADLRLALDIVADIEPKDIAPEQRAAVRKALIELQPRVGDLLRWLGREG